MFFSKATNAKVNFLSFLWHALFLALAKNFMDVNTIIPAMLIKSGGTTTDLGILTAIMIGGALSGKTYTTLYGRFATQGHPEYVWYALGAHTLVGLILLFIFTRTLGEFKEQEE